MSDALKQLRLACTDARERFADALVQAGFRPVPCSDNTWVGYLDTSSLAHAQTSPSTTVSCPVEITVTGEFPYVPPVIRPVTLDVLEQLNVKAPASPMREPSHGWHREQSGAFCLYVDDDGTGMPWADAASFLEQATAWLDHDHRGWPDDDGALDLERYLPADADRRLVLYRDTELEPGKYLKLKPATNGALRITAARPRKGGGRSGQRLAPNTVRVVDGGELAAPIRSWDDLLTQAGGDTAESLIKDRQLGLDHVAIRYQRHGELGVVISSLTGSGSPQLAALNAAPDDQRTRNLRAHPNATTLATKTVAVVGVGAVGSVVADLLHRHGVGRLILVDGDVLKPGNTTRHVLGDEYIGLHKAKGIERLLSQRSGGLTKVQALQTSLTDFNAAIDLLERVDVVVDATADGRATSLLTAAARAGAGQLVSACVLADGYAVRVDVIPYPDATIVEPPALPPIRTGAQETGCSSPVNATPPAAAVEAAAIAARVTSELLLGRLPAHATELRIISARDADD